LGNVDCQLASIRDLGRGNNAITFGTNTPTVFTLTGTNMIYNNEIASYPRGSVPPPEPVQFIGTPGDGEATLACQIDPVTSVFTCVSTEDDSIARFFILNNPYHLEIGNSDYEGFLPVFIAATCPVTQTD
jgi:hypothetical protein